MNDSAVIERAKAVSAAQSLADAPRLTLSPLEFSKDTETARHINGWLGSVDAATRVRWSLANLPGPFAMSSSFGAQAAVSLHLVTQADPRIPVILIDTGYLFPETHQFIDQLTRQLSLNIQRFASPQPVAEFEAQFGKLWEQGREGLDRYLELRKVEPMRRALKTLGTRTWFAGLRRSQAASRAALNPLEVRDGRFKVHPIFDWSDRDVYLYLKANGLSYHPLWDQGYVSIGDWHSTKSLSEVSSAEELRFSGLKRECGIHGLEG
ncbi:MAG TPA: phosphoadenylyl-sulfate reductase [Steroidobacteraceae bacterium]|nr:phosphoadenylyl-sulfate reductase [Steroidobacteraceae bacterium]